MATGMEFVSSLIIRYMEFERLYLGRPSALTHQLEDALCNLYAAVLVYLSKARRYFTDRTGGKQVLIALSLVVSNLIKFVLQEALSTQWMTVLMCT
jgi:hypothetical protein